MKRNWIRYGLIVFTMLLCICFTAIAAAEELPASATNLSLNVETTATITADQLTWFRFTPTKTATYSFYSSSDEDTYGYLYEKTGENEITQIDSSDDDGENSNFLIKRILTKGNEYYFAVRFYNTGKSGSFPVKIEEFIGLSANPVGDTYISAEIGDTVQLAVEASSQKGTVTYQWLNEDQNGLWTEINGKTTATFSTTAIGGRSKYICYVTDGVTSLGIRFEVAGNDALTAYVDGTTYSSTSISVVPNEPAVLKVQASSASGTVTYKWYKSWNDDVSFYHDEEIAGANSATYTAENINRMCTYRCEVSSLSQSTYVYFYVSCPITVNIVGENNRTVAPGGSTTMSITATSALDVSYQWYCYQNDYYSDSTAIEGATSSSYKAENISQRTYYYCKVSNGYTSTNSSTFDIQIEGDFEAWSSNSYVSIDPDDPDPFTVTAYAANYNNEDDQFTYQWYGPVSNKRDPIEPITGKTEATLSIENAAAGYYLCKVTNTAGIEKKLWFRLSVDYDWYIDDTSSYVYGDAGETTTISVDVEGTGTFSYQWYIADDENSSFEYAQKIDGATEASYEITNPQKYHSVYFCEVTDIYGNTETARSDVYIEGELSLTTSGQIPGAVEPGGSATFTVIATGDGDITYTWATRTYSDGTWGEYQIVPGATGASYTVNNVQARTEIYCRASSPFTNNGISFNLFVNNNLRLTADGSSYKTIYVNPNEAATLTVTGSCSSGPISYQWYRRANDAYGHSANLEISNATAATYTTGPITNRQNYYCIARDSYGNSANCEFSVNIDNHLSATVAGKTENNDHRTVEPGGSVTMKVTATATNTEGLSYHWSKYVRNSSGYGSTQDIPGVTGNELTETVTVYTEYYCTVEDAYGNNATVWFYIGIDNHLTVTVDGKETTTDRRNVDPGESVTMKVAATATNTEGLSYHWSKYVRNSSGYGSTQEIPDVTGNELTETVTAYTEYYCRVEDVYGNNETVWFYIGIDNHLTVTVDGKATDTDRQSIAPNESITLKVDARATNTENMTYRWSKHIMDSNGYYGYWQEVISSVTGNELTTEAITAYTEYQCVVQDTYGNSATVWFYIEIDNQLTATIAGTAETRENRKVAYGGHTNLKVDVSATNMEGITYWWIKSTRDINGYDNWQNVSDATGNELTTEAITAYTRYECRVQDAYGNTRYLDFYIEVDNGLKVLAVGDTDPVVRPGNTVTLQVSATVNSGSIHYQWAREYLEGNGYWTSDVIEGATGATYTTEGINRSMTYTCTVTDDFYNRETVSFQVGIDNGLTVSAVGNTDFSVSYGNTATLEVTASVNSGDTHYQWYKREDIDQGWTYRQIVNATNASYTTGALDQAEHFYCRVTDDYGNNREIYFNIGIENHLTVTAEGVNGNGNTKTITVQPGESRSLQVTASADNMAGITYQWCRGEWDEEDHGWYTYQMPGETYDSLAVENINERKMFRCDVTDIYGNSKNFWFYLEIDNQLFATIADDTVLTVNPGVSTNLAVTASCATGSLRYQWFRQTYNAMYGYYSRTKIPGATAASFTTENLNARTVFYCEVMDDYNNSRTVQFDVGIENRIKVSSSGYVSVPKGQDAELEVQAICRSGSLSYGWYINDVKDPYATSPVYTIRNVTSNVNVRCVITDTYGNQKTVWMGVSVENHLSAYLTATVNGVPTEIERDDYWNGYLTVAPESQITLTCAATCDEGSLRYVWEDGDTRETISTENTITIQQARYRYVYCTATDMYGNSMRENLTINVENGFSLERVGTMFRTVQEGSEVVLEVTASATNGTLEYGWYDRSGLLTGATTDQLTITATRNETYTCRVKDIYGNSRGVQFYVIVNTPEPLQLGQMTRVNLSNGGNRIYVFTPSESGSYTIMSYGSNAYPAVTLYDSDNWIAYDENSGEGNNFKLTAELEAGKKYRFMVYNYSSGSFSMKLVKDSEETILETFSGYVLRTGQKAKLPIGGTATATSSDPSVIRVVDGLTIEAMKEGTARVTVTVITTEQNYEIRYDISVRSGAVLNLPAGLTTVETEAFAGDNSIRFVNLNSNTKYVGPFAFDESGLLQIVVPAADIRIAFSALNDTRATILCPENSLAAEMAMRFGYRFLYLP